MALSRALVVLRSHLDPSLSSCGERTLEGTNNVDVKQEKKKEKTKRAGGERKREKESKKKERRRKEERERKRRRIYRSQWRRL